MQHTVRLWGLAFLACLAILGITRVAAAQPQYGGTLRAAIAAEPPSLDPHQEQTFAVMMTAGPVYNTLLQFSPTNYPEIVGDLAAAWTISPDGLIYIFTIHQGVKFHDGGDLTSADIKASYAKIIWPPEGVFSTRQETFRTDLSAMAKSLRAEQTDIEFHNLPPAEVEAVLKQKGDTLKVQNPGWVTFWGISPNMTRPPLNDERVRTALSLAINRYDMAKTVYPLTGLDGVGGLMRPGTPWALDAEELAPLPGYGTNTEADRSEAKRLLAAAGFNDHNPLHVVLKNRNTKLPYIDFGVYVISAWQKIGVQVEHRLEETATWNASQQNRDFELIVSPGSDYADEPDIQLSRWLTGGPQNYTGQADPEYDRLYEQQSQEIDLQKRLALVKEMQRLVMDKANFIQGLWSSRAVVHSAKVKGYVAHPSHYTNQRLQDVWLAQ